MFSYTAIKTIVMKIFKAMAGFRLHSLLENHYTVGFTFQAPFSESNYLEEIIGTFEALHKRIEKGWLHDDYSTAKEKSTHLHSDSPLSSAKKSSVSRGQQSLSLTKTTAQDYLNKGDELMEKNATEEALKQYEAGLSYLELIAFHKRSTKKLYNTLTGRIAGVKDLLTQTAQQGVEKSMPLSG